MPNKPKVQDVKANPRQYPTWRLCPRCQGGRGELVLVQDEDDELEPTLQVQTCSFCEGERILPR